MVTRLVTASQYFQNVEVQPVEVFPGDESTVAQSVSADRTIRLPIPGNPYAQEDLLTVPTQFLYVINSTAPITFHVTITTVAAEQIRIRTNGNPPSTPAQVGSVGTVRQTINTIANTESVTFYKIQNPQTDFFLWMHPETSAEVTSITVTITHDDTSKAAITLDDTQAYQVWNNGPGIAALAVDSAAPLLGPEHEGSYLGQNQQFNFEKTSTNTLWVRSQQGTARVAISEMP